MRKIDEVIAKYNYDNDSFLSIESMMRDYAEWYAKECLKIAAKEARTKLYIPIEDGCHDFKNMYDIVDEDSILNIQLPEHD